MPRAQGAPARSGMRMPANLHLDRPPALLHHPPCPLRRHVRLDGPDHELQANAGLCLGLVPAAEELVYRHAERLALEVEQGHLNGSLGKAVAECGLVEAPAEPLRIERVGTEDERSEDVVD